MAEDRLTQVSKGALQFDPVAYRCRNAVERSVGRLKELRRIATRYDKLARNYLAATTLVGALYWIKL